MPMAVPGMARISVVSASIAPRPGARVRPMIQAIGTPISEANEHGDARRYRSELMMNFGVSMLTCSEELAGCSPPGTA